MEISFINLALALSLEFLFFPAVSAAVCLSPSDWELDFSLCSSGLKTPGETGIQFKIKAGDKPALRLTSHPVAASGRLESEVWPESSSINHH